MSVFSSLAAALVGFRLGAVRFDSKRRNATCCIGRAGEKTKEQGPDKEDILCGV